MLLIFLLPLAGSLQVIGTLGSSRIFGLTLTDPLAFLEVLFASHSMTVLSLTGALIILGAYILLGKAFCSWVCPVGFLIEGVHYFRAYPNFKHPKQYYWALPLFLIFSFVLGVPVFQTFSPLGIVYRSLLFGFGLEVLILLLIVILELVGIQRGWCRIVCPIGVFYALVARWSPLNIHCDKEKCIHCLKCVKACDYTAKDLRDTVLGAREYCTSNLCTRCGRCIDACPTKALEFSWMREIPQHRGEDESSILEAAEFNREMEVRKLIGVNQKVRLLEGTISRRRVLQGAGILALAGIVYKSSYALADITPKVLRPPGAVPDDEFLAKCIRCGKCIEICPDKTLLSAHLDQGLNLGTPYFIPRQIPCSLCMKCPDVCPTGALKPLTMRDVRIGVAEIDQDRCYAYQGDVCRSCYNNCPLIDEAIKMVEFQYPVIDPQVCTGCGICEYVCVTDPPAIRIKRILS